MCTLMYMFLIIMYGYKYEVLKGLSTLILESTHEVPGQSILFIRENYM